MLPGAHRYERFGLSVARACDVDDTIAPIFQPAAPQMIAALQRLLADGILLLLISGQNLGNIFHRVLRPLDPALRRRMLVAHCNGAEVFDFDAQGRPGADPLYTITAERSRHVDPVLWRGIVQKLITQFDLRPWPVMDLDAFRRASGEDPRAVMMDDRRVQITLENSRKFWPLAETLPRDQHRRQGGQARRRQGRRGRAHHDRRA